MESISITALSGFVALITAIFPVIALIAISFRTRSSHTFLMYRLWQLIINPREIEDPVVKQHLDEEAVVATFRVRYNIRIELPTQAHKLIHWAKSHEVSIPAIGACGYFFDFKLCELRKNLPSRRKTGALAAIVVLLGFCAFTLSIIGTSDAVLGQFKESKRYFWIKHNTATPIFPKGPAVTQDSCKSLSTKEPTPESFSAADQAAICKAFVDEKEASATSAFLKEGLWAQRLFLAAVVFSVLTVTTMFFWAVQESRASHRLKKFLEEKPAPPVTEVPSTPSSGQEPPTPIESDRGLPPLQATRGSRNRSHHRSKA